VVKDFPPDQTPDHPVVTRAGAPALAPELPPEAPFTLYLVADGSEAALGGTAAAGGAAGVSTATWAGVPAAAVTGWMLGGWFIGKTGWHGDDQWFCRWNPGFRAARSSYCDPMMNTDTTYLRAQTLIQAANMAALRPSSAEGWTRATTVAEVLVDPGAVDALGKRTAVAEELPATSPDATTQNKLNEAVDPAKGTQLATDPAPSPDPGRDPATDPRPAPDPISGAPPVVPPGGKKSDCSDFGLLDFLNPLNLVDVLKCVLQYLFIPSSGRFDALKASFSSTLGNLVGRPLDVVQGVWSSLSSGVRTDCAGPLIHIPGVASWGGFDIQPLNACSGVMKTVADLVRPILVVISYLGAVLAAGRLVASAFGMKLFGDHAEAATA